MKKYEESILFGLIDFPKRPWLHIFLLPLVGIAVSLLPIYWQLSNLPVVNEKTLPDVYYNPFYLIPFMFFAILIVDKWIYRSVAAIVRDANAEFNVHMTDEEVFTEVMLILRKPKMIIYKFSFLLGIVMMTNLGLLICTLKLVKLFMS